MDPFGSPIRTWAHPVAGTPGTEPRQTIAPHSGLPSLPPHDQPVAQTLEDLADLAVDHLGLPQSWHIRNIMQNQGRSQAIAAAATIGLAVLFPPAAVLAEGIEMLELATTAADLAESGLFTAQEVAAYAEAYEASAAAGTPITMESVQTAAQAAARRAIDARTTSFLTALVERGVITTGRAAWLAELPILGSTLSMSATENLIYAAITHYALQEALVGLDAMEETDVHNGPGGGNEGGGGMVIPPDQDVPGADAEGGMIPYKLKHSINYIPPAVYNEFLAMNRSKRNKLVKATDKRTHRASFRFGRIKPGTSSQAGLYLTAAQTGVISTCFKANALEKIPAPTNTQPDGASEGEVGNYDAIGIDQLGAFYDKAVVTGCTIRVDYHVGGTHGSGVSDGYVIGLALKDDTTSLSQVGHWQESGNTIWKIAGEESTGSMVAHVKPSQFFGVPNPLSDSLQELQVNLTGDALPGRALYWHLFFHRTQGLAPGGHDTIVSGIVTLDYDVVWSEPKDIARGDPLLS